jgi:WD40 repeat protein/tRNA A-37 threonylcarbamoyl transferase component Bud32
MAFEGNGVSDRDERLDEAVTRYLEAAEAGRAPDHRTWLDRYPDLADDLAEFFADLDHLDSLTAPLRQAAGLGVPTARPEETPTDADGRAEGPPRIPEGGFAFGDFQIVQEIGRGGMGVVYRARQRSPHRLVALKMIRSGAWAADEEVQRFRNEAEAAGGLDHPNIVPVYEVGQEQGQLYFTMRLVEGTNLAEDVRRFRDDPRGAARLMATVARAVHHAHQRGVLHRDLKPSNILLDRDGVPHVTDFGLAKRLGTDASVTQTGALVGTPSYMAPEQAAGKKGAVSTASDVFSLGAILYTLLAGEPPFRGDTPLAVLEQVRSHSPSPLTGRGRRVDADLQTIVHKCLEKDPQARYASAAALADDLERWLAGMPIEARPVGRLVRAWRWGRRNPLVAGLMTATAILLVVAVVGQTLSTIVIDEQRRQALRQRDLAIAAEARARQGELATRQSLYVADMRVGWNAWRSCNGKQMHEQLSRPLPAPDQPDLRGFEWRYLHLRDRGEDRVLQGHSAAVFHVCYCPDGTRLATASRDGTVRLWDARTCQEICVFRGHRGEVNAVSCAPDGRTLASAGDDGTIRLWDLAPTLPRVVDHARLMWQAHTSDALEVEFSPDGTQICSGGHDGLAKLWDAATGRLLATFTGNTDRILSLAFAPDGKMLATSAEDHCFMVWAVPQPEQLQSASPPTVTPLRGTSAAMQVPAIAFSPDGRQLAIIGGGIQAVKFWDFRANTVSPPVLEHDFPIESVAFSQDGRYLAAGGADGAIKVLDLQTREVQTLLGHVGIVYRLSFAPGGRALASACLDGSARIWEVGRETDCHRLPLPAALRLRQVAFSPDGKTVATREFGGAVRLWERETWKPLRELRAGVVQEAIRHTLSFSADGGTLAVGLAGGIRLWDVATGRVRIELPADGFTAAAFSADGRVLATLGTATEWRVVLRDAATANPLQTLPAQLGDSLLAVSPDARRVATGTNRGGLFLWDSSAGGKSTIYATGKKGTNCLAFSPDGQTLATGNDDGTVAFWDAATGTLRAAGPAHRPQGLLCLAFSPEGQTLATGGADGKIRLWNVPTGQEILALNAPGALVWNLTFSPNGDTLAATILDGWDKQKELGVYVWSADPMPAAAQPGTTPPQP